jgi:hypothetical protein
MRQAWIPDMPNWSEPIELPWVNRYDLLIRSQTLAVEEGDSSDSISPRVRNIEIVLLAVATTAAFGLLAISIASPLSIADQMHGLGCGLVMLTLWWLAGGHASRVRELKAEIRACMNAAQGAIASGRVVSIDLRPSRGELLMLMLIRTQEGDKIGRFVLRSTGLIKAEIMSLSSYTGDIPEGWALAAASRIEA